MKNYVFIIFLFVFFYKDIFAQPVPTMVSEENAFIRSICYNVEKHGWLYFKDDITISPEKLINSHKESLGLSTQDDLVLWKNTTESRLNTNLLKYYQYHNGIFVENSDFAIHSKDSIMTVAHGKIIEGLNVGAEPFLDEPTALIFELY